MRRLQRRDTSACRTGLMRKSSAPSSRHLRILVGEFSDDIITTGISRRSADSFTRFSRS